MEWTIEPTGHHMLTMGGCIATVWPSGNEHYAGMVMAESISSVSYGFITIDAAQAWCEAEIAELRTSGKCEAVTAVADG